MSGHQKFHVEMMALSKLKPHPLNYKEHPEDQLEHIKASLETHGFYKNVVTARDLTILAGHGVVLAAKDLGWRTVPVQLRNLGPEDPEALKLLIGDNETPSLAYSDDRGLTELLKAVNQKVDLLGTGFDKRMLAALVMVTRPANEISNFDAAAEWIGAGMPEHDAGEIKIHCSVYFKTEEDRTEFLERLGVSDDRVLHKRGTTVSMWWPPRERNDPQSLRLEADKKTKRKPAAKK